MEEIERMEQIIAAALLEDEPLQQKSKDEPLLQNSGNPEESRS